MRVAILYNDDPGLAHGSPEDRFAAQAVLGTVDAVERALIEAGHQTTKIAVTADPRAILAALDRARAELVFNLAEAVDGEARLESALAALLELARIPYTGSAPEALTIALDKPLAKAWLAQAGVPVPRGATLLSPGDPLPERLEFPWIVKPARQDASHGISAESVVFDAEAARARAALVIERYAGPALIEEFVDGRELNVSILGDEVLPFGEIDFSSFPAGRPPLVTYEAKWVESSPDYLGTPSIAARQLAPDLAAKVSEISLAAYRALGIRDYGRIDLRIHRQRGPLVLEANPNPDLSSDAGLARAAGRMGLDYRALIERIVGAARARRTTASINTSPALESGAIRMRPIAVADRAPLEAILRATGAFTADEVAVALDLIDLGIRKEDSYRFAVAETSAGAVAGYSCYGPTPLTEGVWDLYWIAVDPTLQGGGVGRRLLADAERSVAQEGGRSLLIETASKPSYDATRGFYLKTGYTEVARVPDFYKLGDDKVIYMKRLGGGSGHA